jgi:hypothetical protein
MVVDVVVCDEEPADQTQVTVSLQAATKELGVKPEFETCTVCTVELLTNGSNTNAIMVSLCFMVSVFNY